MTSKESLLLKVADAALRLSDSTVRQMVYPVLGEDNLRNLAAEFKASRSVITTRMQATYRESFTQHYRKGLVKLPDVLEFRCENSHQPVLDAFALVRRYAEDSRYRYYPDGETIGWHRACPGTGETDLARTGALSVRAEADIILEDRDVLVPRLARPFERRLWSAGDGPLARHCRIAARPGPPRCMVPCRVPRPPGASGRSSETSMRSVMAS